TRRFISGSNSPRPSRKQERRKQHEITLQGNDISGRYAQASGERERSRRRSLGGRTAESSASRADGPRSRPPGPCRNRAPAHGVFLGDKNRIRSATRAARQRVPENGLAGFESNPIRSDPKLSGFGQSHRLGQSRPSGGR